MMTDQNYFTAYDKDGNLIKYQSFDDIPKAKQDGAFMEWGYRIEGLTDYADRLNEYRRKEAMKEK